MYKNITGFITKFVAIQKQGESDEDTTYWEPAESINEIYEQLSSKKYREIIPNQVK